MKLLLENWRQYLNENEASKVTDFFKDIGYEGEETIYEFDEGCQVKLILVQTEEGVEINLIEVLSDECLNKGYASEVMNRVIDSADKHKIIISLQATPIDNKIGEEDLLSWYKKYGFEPEEEDYSKFELVRFPKGKTK